MGDHRPDGLLPALPRSAGPGRSLRTDRVWFLRSHLVMNSAYFLATENILNLDLSTEVAVDTVCLRIIMEKRRELRGEPWPISPPPLCVATADEKYGLGTSRLDEITVHKVGWTEDALV